MLKYKIKDNYIYVKDEGVHPLMKTVIAQVGFTRRGNYWRAQDDALRRAMLGIPVANQNSVYNELTVEEIEKQYPFLREFQKTDVKKMVEKGTMLNANAMGLGKTLETIVTLDILGSNLNLIICPKSVRGSWKNELIKWLSVSEDDINIIEGTPKQREEKVKNLKKYNIINYELLRNHTNETMKVLRKTKWDSIVCDEAHRIKSRDAKQTEGVKLLNAKHKFALTGTPIQNMPNDLWSILHWLDSYWSGKSYWRFVETFCEVEENFFGKEIKGLTPNEYNREALRTILSEIMIRREYDASLPDKIEIPVSLEMTNKHAKMYKQVTEEIIIELQEEKIMLINSALTRLLRLQQCTSNPGKFDIKDNPKFEFVKELLEDNPDKKVVVFSRFKETINALEDYLKVPTVKLTGDTKDRDAAIKKFQNKKTRAFLATIGAAGEGIDGLQKVSDTMVFIDKDWSPAKNQQAVGRLVRQGQKNPVKVYSLNLVGTIDDYVENLLNRKVSDIIEVLENQQC